MRSPFYARYGGQQFRPLLQIVVHPVRVAVHGKQAHAHDVRRVRVFRPLQLRDGGL